MSTIAILDGQGLCAQVDPELFFPTQGETGAAARQVCAACPVTAQCLQIALAAGVSGIWGGTSHAERRKMGAAASIHAADLVRTCGTAAGAARHRRAGEPTCGPCAAAHARAQQAREARRREVA